MTWEPASFEVAGWRGPYKVAGYIYRGLGLSMTVKGSPKGRRAPWWRLTHLNTGHQVLAIEGHVAVAFPIASEAAELSDWDFASLRGWRDRDPELPSKMAALALKHGKRVRYSAAGSTPQGEEVARQIATARA